MYCEQNKPIKIKKKNRRGLQSIGEVIKEQYPDLVKRVCSPRKRA